MSPELVEREELIERIELSEFKYLMQSSMSMSCTKGPLNPKSVWRLNSLRNAKSSGSSESSTSS